MKGKKGVEFFLKGGFGVEGGERRLYIRFVIELGGWWLKGSAGALWTRYVIIVVGILGLLVVRKSC